MPTHRQEGTGGLRLVQFLSEKVTLTVRFVLWTPLPLLPNNRVDFSCSKLIRFVHFVLRRGRSLPRLLAKFTTTSCFVVAHHGSQLVVLPRRKRFISVRVPSCIEPRQVRLDEHLQTT